MDEDNWDDGPTTTSSAPTYNNNNAGGFGGKGRSYGNRDDYNNSNNSSGFGSGGGDRRQSYQSSYGGGGDDFGDSQNDGNRRGGRGGGRGRGRGGGYNNNNQNDQSWDGGSSAQKSSDDWQPEGGSSNNDSWLGGGGNSNNDDGWNGGGDRRGGGRGRGGRGGRGGRSYGDNNDDGGFGGNSGGFGGDDDGGFGGGGRGRGRGGGRGGRGGRSYDNNDDGGFGGGGFGGDSGGFGGDGNDDGGFGGGRGRGRGRGRGGGGRGGRDGGFDGGNGGGEDGDRPEKPREIYIPPDRATDDETLYGSGIKAGINFSKYDSIEVKTSGEDIPPKVNSFEEANLRGLLAENIKKSGYTTPTPIQKYGIPIVLAGRDLMGCAQTGSGKTAAYLIPIIQRLLTKPRDEQDMSSMSQVEPRALIMAPTRELAIQIYDECRKFSKDSILKCSLIYGGAAVGHQMKQMFYGCDILVATTGRLKDFVGRGKITFNAMEIVVLDEADRMVDMGFIGDVEMVLRHETMPPCGERQTLMFSATFPSNIQELAAKFLNNYIFVAVGIVGSACSDIEQSFLEVAKSDKRSKLKELLEEESRKDMLKGILVFVDQKRTADFIAAFLSDNNYPTTSIHGDRLQREREEALNDFKSGRMAILVATAVAARGLDIKNARYVINYDLPQEIDEYIHRIGRTGRVGNQGKAVSFYDDSIDGRIQNDLVRILELAGQEVPSWLASGAGASNLGPSSGFGGHDIRDFPEQIPDEQGTLAVENDDEW